MTVATVLSTLSKLPFDQANMDVAPTPAEEAAPPAEEGMLSLEEAEVLILQAQASSKFLSSLNPEDVRNLAEHLVILKFEANEQIIKKGELASWMGIVLAGSLASFIASQVR